MTITQLEYLVAIADYGHFGKAADACSVTQPSLSMQIQKLEDELEVQLLDRKKQPTQPTEIGALIVQQARHVLQSCEKLKGIVDERKNELAGEVRLGVIPTVAPYLVPLFLKQFLTTYSDIRLKITEQNTESIIEQLKNGQLDIGLMATPFQDDMLKEYPLFYEELLVYVSPEHSLYYKKYAVPEELDPNELWLLEEGHCLRSQIEHLCQLTRQAADLHQIEYKAGSLETLKKMVNTSGGMTILPELATQDFTEDQLELIRYFQTPAPVREVGLVTSRNYLKEKIVAALSEEIQKVVPAKMLRQEERAVVSL
ncbi:hydrogen peroxide-inducible genes activator [Siphonobacter sp.]|uniref:hydrogen peroxide-inducible genes activator n=1 Tax=Siphonobacter sp. TaxID=1869184 RepID=UPI003B3A2984